MPLRMFAHVIDDGAAQLRKRLDKGGRLFVANTSAGTVLVLDLETLKVLSTPDAGKGPDGLWVTSLP